MEQPGHQFRLLADQHRAEADLKRALLAGESSPDSARGRELREGIDRSEEMYALFMALYKTAREYPSRFRAAQDQLTRKRRFANVLVTVRVDGGDGKTREIVGESEKESCAICLQEFKSGFASMMNCSHFFHHECILTWLQQARSCPICRYLPNPN